MIRHHANGINVFLEAWSNNIWMATKSTAMLTGCRLVGNLLDMTRLQSGTARLNQAPTDIQDLVGAIVGQMEDRLGNRKLTLDVAENLPLVPMDAVLVGQAMGNLLDNAVKFSPTESPIQILEMKTGCCGSISPTCVKRSNRPLPDPITFRRNWVWVTA
jgi:light-regulated signal transduction histidine kinase (bacteriophytochrome)